MASTYFAGRKCHTDFCRDSWQPHFYVRQSFEWGMYEVVDLSCFCWFAAVVIMRVGMISVIMMLMMLLFFLYAGRLGSLGLAFALRTTFGEDIRPLKYHYTRFRHHVIEAGLVDRFLEQWHILRNQWKDKQMRVSLARSGGILNSQLLRASQGDNPARCLAG